MTQDLPKVRMQLAGADGNAFAILGTFKREAKKQGWNTESINEVISTAMSGDYNNLLSTIVKYVDDVYEDEDDY
jgi:hypothetical protein